MNRIALALCLLLAGAAQANTRYVGYAYDLETGKLVYTETHLEAPTGDDDVTLKTTYRDGDGAAFAEREARFDGFESTPDFELTDRRFGYTEGVVEQAAGFRVYTKEDGEDEEDMIEAGRRPLVIDAGFDRFIRMEWDSLQAGDFARFDFVNCDRLSLIALRLSKKESRMTEFGAVTDFEMEPNNWLIRLLVDPIIITYRDTDKTLLEYKGLSNVKNASGKNYVVRIFFPPEERETGVQTIAASGDKQ
ncbi:MAG: hypothetical protein AAGE01_26025 [Pseudomonadota bacterium]